MKRGLIIFGISAFLLGLMIYIGLNYSPYDTEKLNELALAFEVKEPVALTDNVEDLIDYGLIFTLVNIPVVLVVAVLGLAFCMTFVGGLHMIIEKLFFKKFFEEPRVWPALRRGFILFLVIFGLVFFRLIGGFVWQNVVLILILAVTLEIVAIKFTDKPR